MKKVIRTIILSLAAICVVSSTTLAEEKMSKGEAIAKIAESMYHLLMDLQKLGSTLDDEDLQSPVNPWEINGGDPISSINSISADLGCYALKRLGEQWADANADAAAALSQEELDMIAWETALVFYGSVNYNIDDFMRIVRFAEIKCPGEEGSGASK